MKKGKTVISEEKNGRKAIWEDDFGFGSTEVPLIDEEKKEEKKIKGRCCSFLGWIY